MEEMNGASPKRSASIPEARMQLAEVKRQDWVVDAEAGTTVEDVLSSGYFAHMAARMAINDRIEVRLETGEWILELIVLDVGRNWAKCFVAQHYDLTKAPKTAAVPDAFRIEFKGPHRKHAVIRNSDNSVVKEEFARKPEAEAWLKSYETSIGGV